MYQLYLHLKPHYTVATEGVYTYTIYPYRSMLRSFVKAECLEYASSLRHRIMQCTFDIGTCFSKRHSSCVPYILRSSKVIIMIILSTSCQASAVQ